MFYVYQKRRGRIISASEGAPVIRAGGELLIIELDQVIPTAELASWRIKDGELQKVRTKSARKQAEAKAEREAAYRDDQARFWELVEDSGSGAEKLREALHILGRHTFPKG